MWLRLYYMYNILFLILYSNMHVHVLVVYMNREHHSTLVSFSTCMCSSLLAEMMLQYREMSKFSLLMERDPTLSLPVLQEREGEEGLRSSRGRVMRRFKASRISLKDKQRTPYPLPRHVKTKVQHFRPSPTSR